MMSRFFIPAILIIFGVLLIVGSGGLAAPIAIFPLMIGFVLLLIRLATKAKPTEGAPNPQIENAPKKTSYVRIGIAVLLLLVILPLLIFGGF